MSEISVVKNKALKSAKWMILTSVVSMLFSCIANILLGNISPETLGVYSAVNVFISSLTTFVGMGGAVVLSNFFPKMDSDVKKRQLLNTYIAISAGMYVVFVLAILLFPELNTLLSGGLEGELKYVALFVMAPIFITMTVVSYLLIALLEARISNIMSKFYTVLLPIVLLVLYIVDSSLIEQNLALIVFCSLIAANLLAVLLGVTFIKKQKILVKASGFYLPKGFIPFTLTTFLLSLFSFLYRNADKIFLISLDDMGQLGYYQAIISILNLVEVIPNLLGNVTIPYFSNALKLGDEKVIVESYERIEKYMLLFLVSCIIGVITLADVGLRLFGQGYVDYKYLLMILLFAKCVSSLGFTNLPMMVVLEKNGARLISSAIQIAIQFAITFFTIGKLGIFGVVLGRSISVCLGQVIPQLTLRFKSGYSIKISRAYFVGVVCTAFLAYIQIYFDMNLIISIVIGILTWLFFIWAGQFRKDDFKRVLNMIFKR